MLVHECPKETLDAVAKDALAKLFPTDSDSQDALSKSKISKKAVRDAISEIADKKNYGLTIDDLEPDEDGEKPKKIPGHLAVWRWIVKSRKTYFSEELLTKMNERHAERMTVR